MNDDLEGINSAAFGQLAVKVGLITPQQLAEGLEEARSDSGQANPPLPHFIRVTERKGWVTNLQTSKLLKGDTDGYFMGGYRLMYKISSGSFGRVFRAVERGDDPQSGRVVAVKVLRKRWSEDKKRIDLFIREGKVGLSLKHPNIVEVLAINQDAQTKQYYLVMEFIEGGNLREWLQLHKKMSVEQSLRILEDCAAGLAHAYARGVTHRDIKLTNILMATTGDAKLTDFGLAHLVDVGKTREGDEVDRTVDYAGLEKATGVKAGDIRSDMFFIGCVIFECLTGRSPLEMTKDRHARMAARRFQDMQSLKPGELHAPPSVYTLIETLMAYDPKRRYQTPSQLLDAVRAVRRELAGGGQAGNGKPAARTVFLVESHTGRQDKLREFLKDKLGYRVLIASDPARALDRYRQQQYDALLVDVDTTGEDGLIVFERVMTEASVKGARCAGIVLLGEEQADWAGRVPRGPTTTVLSLPLNGKAIQQALHAAFPPG